MRALRALIAILLAGVAAAGSQPAPVAAAPALHEACGDPGWLLSRVDPATQPNNLLASSAATVLTGVVEEASRSHAAAGRALRPTASWSVPVRSARVAAVLRDRLEFARRIDVAMLGYFSHGSTSPPSSDVA